MINRNSAGVLVLKGQRWNSWILSRRTTAKAFTKDVFINQERKLGDRRWLDTIVVRRHKRCRLGIVMFVRFQRTIAAPYEKSKSLGSGGSMVARLKLKGIDGRTHQRWSLRFNLTQHGETYQVQTWWGLTVWKHFLDFMGGGAWPFLVGGVICLVDSDNERDGGSLLVARVLRLCVTSLLDNLVLPRGSAPQ
jgi:hypothetical protein